MKNDLDLSSSNAIQENGCNNDTVVSEWSKVLSTNPSNLCDIKSKHPEALVETIVDEVKEGSVTATSNLNDEADTKNWSSEQIYYEYIGLEKYIYDDDSS